MLQLARAIVWVASDVLRLVVSFLRSSSVICAENLVLRRQLARYIERGIRPRRVDHATRVSRALFSRFFDWRNAVVNVRPSTIVRWHRLGWRDLLARARRALLSHVHVDEADNPGTGNCNPCLGHRILRPDDEKGSWSTAAHYSFSGSGLHGAPQ